MFALNDLVEMNEETVLNSYFTWKSNTKWRNFYEDESKPKKVGEWGKLFENALREGNPRKAKQILVENAHKLNDYFPDGSNCLHKAASLGNIDLIRFILNVGVKYTRDSHKKTPAEIAKSKKQKEAFNFLSKYEILLDIEQKVSEKKTSKDGIQLLKKHPDLVNAIGESGKSIISYIVLHENPKLLEILLQIPDIDMNILSCDGSDIFEDLFYNIRSQSFSSFAEQKLKEYNQKLMEQKNKPSNATGVKLFKQITLPPTISSLLTSTNRKDHIIQGCMIMENILSEDECEHFIKETERVGYSNLSKEYPASYRSNDRLLFHSKELADALWKRIAPHLEHDDITAVYPMGFGNEGIWKPVGLNECFKFGRYRAGRKFQPHIDGPWIPRENLASIYTVVVYLNEIFSGGETEILETTEDFWTDAAEECIIKPETGKAFIFQHNIRHASNPVELGVKYIFRTEIMFQRVDTSFIPNPYMYEKSDDYQKMKKLYEDAEDFEKKGKPEEFTSTYLEALSLQDKEVSKYLKKSDLQFHNLPLDILIQILCLCSPVDVAKCMQVNKAWYIVARDSMVWKTLFKNSFPEVFAIEDDPLHPSVRDWYTIFRQRKLLSRDFKTVIVDVTHPQLFQVGMVDMTNSPYSFRRIVQHTSERVSHIRSRLLVSVGENLSRYYHFRIEIAELSSFYLWQHVFKILGVHSDRHPILIATSPSITTTKKSMIIDTLRKYLFSPAVVFVDSSLLVKCEISSQNGCAAYKTCIVLMNISEEKQFLISFISNEQAQSRIVEDVLLITQTILELVKNENVNWSTLPILLSGIPASSSVLELIKEALEQQTMSNNFNFISSTRDSMDVVHGGIKYACLSSFKDQFKDGSLDLQLPPNYQCIYAL